MDQLALHIEYLLLRNDCVILPGIGAFINAYLPARFDFDRGLWIPMHREIRFNQAVNQDDGLLANSYSRKYTLPFNEARALLDTDLKYLRQLIDDEGEVSVGQIGILRKTAENNLTYTPFRKASINDRELGFVPVSITGSEIVLSSEDHTSENPNATISSIPEKDTENIKTDGEKNLRFNTEKNYYIPINKIFAKIAASVIVISMVVICAMFNTDGRIGEDRASVIPVDTTSSAATKNINRKEKSIKVKSDSANAVKVESENNVIVKSDNDNKNNIVSEAAPKKYHLIIGTFKSKPEAEKYISSLNQENRKAEILPSSTLYRVTIASSDDRSELIRILNSPAGAGTYEGAWIFEDKSAL